MLLLWKPFFELALPTHECESWEFGSLVMLANAGAGDAEYSRVLENALEDVASGASWLCKSIYILESVLHPAMFMQMGKLPLENPVWKLWVPRQ